MHTSDRLPRNMFVKPLQMDTHKSDLKQQLHVGIFELANVIPP